MRHGRASGSTREANTTTSDAQTGTGGWTAATIANTGRVYVNNLSSWLSLGQGRSLKFTVNATTVDTAAPTVISNGYSPADNATGVGTNTNLTLTFNEAVQKGTGNIVIRTGASTDVTIDVTGSQVSVGGAGNTVVTINPTNDLSASTAYRVRIDAGAIEDMANNDYAGINDDTTWNFETAAAPDNTAPELAASNPFSPADDATGVPLNANFTVRFNENVQRDASKYIRLFAANDQRPTGAPITVTVIGAAVTINPNSDLPADTGHSIWIEDGAIEDLASNDFAGFENATTWNFTTGAAVQPPLDGGGGTEDDAEDEPPPVAKPGPPRSLRAESGVGEVTLSWDAPRDEGGAAITDYEYRIDDEGAWISIGSAETTVRVTGLSIGAAYVFEVRAVNRGGAGPPSRVEATAGAVLRFAHFANGAGITSALALVNAGSAPVRPTVYFYDTGGALVSAESVVEVTGEMAVAEDGGLAVLTEIAPLGVLTVSTHGRGELLTGSLKVVTATPVGAGLRFDLPQAGRGVVTAGPTFRDAIFPARRREGGLNTGVALHNLQEAPLEVRCRLLRGGAVLGWATFPLAANGQTSWTLDQAFPRADTADFTGSVRCDTADSRGRFQAIALEMDAGPRTFITLPVFPVNWAAGGRAAVLDFAHFVNGDGAASDLVLLNVGRQPSGPPLTPFHTATPPLRPVLYFYDTEGKLLPAPSLVDLTEDLELREDGGLTVRREMEPFHELTVSTHGRGTLVTGSVRVVADNPPGGMLRYDLPHLGEAAAGAGPPLSDAIFPVRRREKGVNTGVALHNLESSSALLRCELLRGGVPLDAAMISLEANGQTSWTIDQAFRAADTSDFTGSVRCTATGGGSFSAVVLEADPAARSLIPLPVFPVKPVTEPE